LTHQQRIEANNLKGLQLRAVIDVAPFDKVVKIAQGYDEMRTKGVSSKILSPFISLASQ
jgi:hypothetical protein